MPHPPVFSPLGTPVTELQSVDSTNNYALGRIHAGMAQHGELVFAHEQVAGKGQMGKKWTANRGENITLSLIINPSPLRVEQQFSLSAAVAAGVYDFFAALAGDDTRIKWPNDLYWQDRKAGGILIESILGPDQSGEMGWKWAVAGIGININQTRFPGTLLNPVSLKQITGKQFNPFELAVQLAASVSHRYLQLMPDGAEEIHAFYNNHLYKKDEPVRLKKDSRVFDATIKSVSPAGHLLVQHAIEEEFSVGGIEWIK